MIDTEELRNLAQQATPGPWSAEGKGDLHMDGISYLYRITNADSPYVAQIATGRSRQEKFATAYYIAAANPAVVLELLDELDRLRAIEAERDALKVQVENLKAIMRGDGGTTRVEVNA